MGTGNDKDERLNVFYTSKIELPYYSVDNSFSVRFAVSKFGDINEAVIILNDINDTITLISRDFHKYHNLLSAKLIATNFEQHDH